MDKPNPPQPPPGPPCRIIIDGKLDRCKKCGSSLYRKWWRPFKEYGCYQPRCENYWNKANMTDKKEKIDDKDYKALIEDLAKSDPVVGNMLEAASLIERVYPALEKMYRLMAQQNYLYFKSHVKAGFSEDRAFKMLLNHKNGGQV